MEPAEKFLRVHFDESNEVMIHAHLASAHGLELEKDACVLFGIRGRLVGYDYPTKAGRKYAESFRIKEWERASDSSFLYHLNLITPGHMHVEEKVFQDDVDDVFTRAVYFYDSHGSMSLAAIAIYSTVGDGEMKGWYYTIEQ